MADRRRPGLRVVVGELNHAVEEVGGEPPIKVEGILGGLDLDALARANPTCRTCTLHRRDDLPHVADAVMDLYRAHLSGDAYREMERMIANRGRDLGWEGIAIDHVSLHRHFTRHVPWEVATARRTAESMLEAKASEQAEAVAAAAMTIAEIAGRAKGKVGEFWSAPEVRISSARESVEVARWVTEVEERFSPESTQVDQLERFVDLLRDLRAVLPAAQWDAFARRFWGRRGGPPPELRDRLEAEHPPASDWEDGPQAPPESAHLAAARRLAVRDSLNPRDSLTGGEES